MNNICSITIIPVGRMMRLTGCGFLLTVENGFCVGTRDRTGSDPKGADQKLTVVENVILRGSSTKKPVNNCWRGLPFRN